MTTHGLGRRMFLGGAGATVALPLFESLGPRGRHAGASAADRTRRLITVYFPNGMYMPDWIPTRTGADFDLPFLLEPLARVRRKILILSGLDNLPGKPVGLGDHAAGTAAVFTCHHAARADGANVRNAVSVDQLAARLLEPYTRIGSLQLGLEAGPNTGACDQGYSCVYTRNVSWATERQPLTKITDPQQVFDVLFAGPDDAATAVERAQRRLVRKSVLDHVHEQAAALARRLGTSDRAKMDEYLSSVRDLEKQIQAAAAPSSACEKMARPAGPADVPTLSRLMNDLMVMAFRCDATRVISHMLGNGYPSRAYPFLGVDENHHELSHYDARKLGTLGQPGPFRIINRWLMTVVADLLEKLDAVREGDGTLLDNTILVMSTDCSDSAHHGHTDMPVLLGGGGAGAFRTGRHVSYAKRPVADLFLSVLNVLGMRATRFGDDSTGPLPDLG